MPQAVPSLDAYRGPCSRPFGVLCLESAVATFGFVVVANDVNFKIASIAQRRVSDHCELRLLRQAKSRMRRRVLSMGERGGVWLQLTTNHTPSAHPT